MALYALGDLHLSLNSNKSMEIFGDGWQDYVLRLKEAFSAPVSYTHLTLPTKA